MYYQPKTIDEALQLKAELKSAGTFLAGGTDVVVALRKGRRRVDNIIDLSHLSGLSEIRREQTSISIGAMTTHAQLEGLEVAAIAGSCATVGGPQIRHLGTVGGQLGTASPAGDVSVALIALKAEIELLSQAGARRLPLEDFFLSPGETAIEEEELICAVHVPLGRRSDFRKIGKRGAVAISVVMAAVSVGPAGDVAIGVGCAAPTPLRCKRAERHLDQRGLDPTTIDDAAQMVREDVSPITDHRGGADYRRAMAGVLVKRLLSGLTAG